MSHTSSRRNFLAAGLTLPAVASASRSADSRPSQLQPPASSSALQYRTLGKTGLRGELPAHVRRATECPLRRLRGLRGSLPERGACSGAVEPGSGAVRKLKGQVGPGGAGSAGLPGNRSLTVAAPTGGMAHLVAGSEPRL